MADNFDNYGMIVQAKVKMPTNQDIDKQIRQLEKSISRLKVSGKFDDSAIKHLSNQLNTLKATISTASFSPAALSDLTNQVNNALKNVNIGNINLGNVTGNVARQAQQVGQQVGKIISDSAEQSISNVSSRTIGKYFRVDEYASNDFRKEMQSLVKQWTNGKGTLTDVNIQTRTTYDKDSQANIERLHQAQVTYNNALGETIKKTIAWRQIGTYTNDKGEEEIIRGFVEVAGQYSKSLDTAKVKTDSFINNQKKLVGSYKNTLTSIKADYDDKSASRPIKLDTHTNNLENQYNEVTRAIEALGNANKDTFTDAQVEVDKQISRLRNLVKEYRNAENVSNKMRGVDFESGLAIAQNDFSKFESSASNFSQLKNTVDTLRTSLNSIGDSNSLNEFNNQLRVANSELNKIKTTASNTNKSNIVGLKVSDLKSQIEDLKSAYVDVNTFETEIDGAKVSVQSLSNELNNVKTQSDFSAVSQKFNLFSNSLKQVEQSATSTSQKTTKLATDIQRTTLIDSIKKWSDNNTKALKKFGKEIDSVVTKLESVDEMTQDDFNRLKQQFKQIQINARDAGNIGMTAFDKLKKAWEKFGGN